MIHINFGKPMPIFPLDSVSLLPQQVVPLHIFEPRYRQMIERCLDSSGQLAMGVFSGDAWKLEYHGRPRLRRAVCVGHIVQHERLADGRFNVLIQGVCRAKIVREMPADGERLYREAMLEPIGNENAEADNLPEVRKRIEQLLHDGQIGKFTAAQPVLEWINNEEIPSAVLLELVTFALISEPAIRYRLLAEGDVGERANLIITELEHLDRMVKHARAQHPEKWPKGCSWN
jgi:Lon protease-like protein